MQKNWREREREKERKNVDATGETLTYTMIIMSAIHKTKEVW